ncbi:hypothetical protein [Flavicella sediminum]|uniref:hypothetical protein n=1 Tax=Flavicella sediminum TaxID=2585141 RepID=UPI0011224FDE|nr:hypothetical protein [Flavicella sediminum]
MKIIKCFVFTATILIATNLYSQESWPYKNNLSSYKQYFKENFGIEISFPKKLKDLDKYSKVWKVRQEKEKISGSFYGPFFITKDKNCMIAFSSTFFNLNSGKKNNKKTHTTFYFNWKSQVITEIETSLGMYYRPRDSRNRDINQAELYNYVNFIFGKQAKEKYNADSYSVSNLPDAHKTYFVDESLEKLRKKKYPYCTSLFIQKDKRAVLDIKFFFTKKGFKKKEKYINMLDKHIWFDENFKPN